MPPFHYSATVGKSVDRQKLSLDPSNLLTVIQFSAAGDVETFYRVGGAGRKSNPDQDLMANCIAAA